MKAIFVLALSITALAFANDVARAQPGVLASSGVYTSAQAARGHAIYAAHCSSCHLNDLTGYGQSSPLVGASFLSDWTGVMLSDLFDKINNSMPADHPGTLSRQQTADVLAFILSSNKYPAGKTELPTAAASLKQIHIDNPPAGHTQPPAPSK